MKFLSGLTAKPTIYGELLTMREKFWNHLLQNAETAGLQ
jgi:hypothetical protein